jgi:Flp pilus assembly protein TadD
MGAALFCLLAGIYLVVHREDASHLRDASEFSEAGFQDKALRESDQVSRRPAETHALLLRAEAYAASGRRVQALDAFAVAANRDPRNWIIRQDWAVELRAAGRRRAAARQMSVALELNPRLDLPLGFTR